MDEDYAREIETYSLEELRGVRERIDREKFPERRRLVLGRIAELEKDPAKRPHGITTVQARTYDAWYGKEKRASKGESEKEKPVSKDERGKDGASPGISLNHGAGVFLRDTAGPNVRILPPWAYNALLGLVLMYGFLVNYLMVRLIPASFFAFDNLVLFLILYFASCFCGIRLFVRSESPWVSFAGFNFVVVPFGAMVTLVLSVYDLGDIQNALVVTAMVTACMLVAGMLYPAFFSRLEGTLALVLLFFIVVELVQIFLGIPVGSYQDILVALIFCGYIGVDWARANNIPKTADNAVDSAAALYMDIINLFLRILRAMGKKRR